MKKAKEPSAQMLIDLFSGPRALSAQLTLNLIADGVHPRGCVVASIEALARSLVEPSGCGCEDCAKFCAIGNEALAVVERHATGVPPMAERH